MWKWQTRICICRQIVKASQNYFCRIESYFFFIWCWVSHLTQQRFWNQTDVWFFDSFQIRQSIFLWKAGSDVIITLSGQPWWKFYHQAFISFIATKYSSISHGQLTVVTVNNFTFQGKVIMEISPPGFIAFIASKYSNVPISRGQLVDPVVLVNNTSAIWTFQT